MLAEACGNQISPEFTYDIRFPNSHLLKTGITMKKSSKYWEDSLRKIYFVRNNQLIYDRKREKHSKGKTLNNLINT